MRSPATTARALTLCSIGSHSALEVAYGARAQGLRNLVVTAKGRERTYLEHFAVRGAGPFAAASIAWSSLRRSRISCGRTFNAVS